MSFGRSRSEDARADYLNLQFLIIKKLNSLKNLKLINLEDVYSMYGIKNNGNYLKQLSHIINSNWLFLA